MIVFKVTLFVTQQNAAMKTKKLFAEKEDGKLRLYSDETKRESDNVYAVIERSCITATPKLCNINDTYVTQQDTCITQQTIREKYNDLIFTISETVTDYKIYCFCYEEDIEIAKQQLRNKLAHFIKNQVDKIANFSNQALKAKREEA